MTEENPKPSSARIKTSSAKAKGRNLQNWVCQKISELIKLPWGKDEPIAPREMGQSGTDVRLVGEARTLFPFSVECKNQKTWNMKKFIDQARDNCLIGTDWLLICKRASRTQSDRINPVVVMDAEAFFNLLGRLK